MALTVLQIVPSLKVGGVETGTVDLARSLVMRGHRAVVISSGGPLVKALEAAGAIHYTLPVDRKNPWVILRMASRVAQIAESHGVDVLHVRSRVPAMIGFLAWRRLAKSVNFRLSERQRIPSFVTTAHGYYSKHPVSAVMGWGRVVIAISERIARHMIDDFKVPPQRIRLIPRGVELERFPFRPPRLSAPGGQWVVSAIGRITPLKGHRELIRAFGMVVKSFPKAKLLIVGEASAGHQRYLAQLRALASRMNLESQVEFLGHEADVARHLAQVDLTLLASTGQEAFGRVLIEAGAAGVPVVATRVGGIAEVVADRKTGLLVPPGDPIALSSAILTLLRDRRLASDLAQAARRRVEALYPLGRMVNETLQAYRDSSERIRILVIKLSAIGDVVLVTASLRAIRERFPKAHLSVLVGRQGRELLHRSPYLDELIVFDRVRDGSLSELLKLGKKLRDAQVDLIVDFQNSRVSHWLGWLSGAPQRYGVAGRRFSWLLTHRVVHPTDRVPPVEHQFRLLKLLGIEGTSTHLELWPGPSDDAWAQKFLSDSWVAAAQPLVAIHPGGHPRWLSKRWPLKRYAQLIDALGVSANARVVLTGSEGERPLADEIYRLCKVKPIVAAGATSLNELAALISKAQVFVGGDTAALHIAAAMGVPLVALFGATDPVRHLPPSPQVRLLKTELPCSPCYHRVCYRRGSGHMECMTSISVQRVAESVLSHLK